MKQEPNNSKTFSETGHSDLTVGPLKAMFDQGGLRYISFAGTETVRGIAFYARDANWGTVPNRVKNASYQQDEQGITLNYQVHCQQGDMDFLWSCSIAMTSNQIIFEINGKANSSFKRNRLGFVVLHGSTLAGKDLKVVHSHGNQTKGQFPQLISPHQPFKDIKAFGWEQNGVEMFMQFEGDIFEMEDQRNWLDASFKTYCTPLELPFPVDLNEGDQVHQKITLKFKGELDQDSGGSQLQLKVGSVSGKLPQIGLTANEVVLEDDQIDRLRRLRLSHLRVEARTFTDNWQQNLKKQLQQAIALDLPVELMVYSGVDTIAQHLLTIKSLSEFDQIRVKWVMCFDLSEKSNSTGYLERAAKAVKNTLGEVSFGGGTDYYFTELNRFRPTLDEIDFIYFSSQPQVHAFDDLSILETCSTFRDIGTSAAKIAVEKPVHITPITLKERLNPNATEPDARILTQEQRTDPRQKAQLAALWTLVSMKYLAASGVEHATFYQTVGEEGVMGRNLEFPVYSALALLERFHGYQLLETNSSAPTLVDGLVFRKGDKKSCLLINLSHQHLEVTVEGKQLAIVPRSFLSAEL